jgi:TolB-like protein
MGTDPAATEIVDSSVPRTRGRPPGKHFWWALAALAPVLLAVLVIPFSGRSLASRLMHRTPQPSITSIAVLPLSNFSGDPGQDYFADGITDELTTMLAKDSTLSITSRTSAMQYQSSSKPLREVAHSLHEDGIIEGSVAHSGNMVHMTLQLIRADTDTHVWAESYDRDMNDVAALPEDAARAIATRLNAASPIHVPARYVSPEAHDFYLRGHYLWTIGRNEEAGKSFKHAVEIQPDYAAGWAGLSQYYSAGAVRGLLDPSEVMSQAKAAGEKAVQLDESLAPAHSALAAAVFFGEWDGPRGLQEVTRAMDLDPKNLEAIHLRAIILSTMGRNQEAVAVQRQGTAADPLAHPAGLAEILMYAHQYDEATDDAEMRLRDFPSAFDLMDVLTKLYRLEGRYKDSAEMLARFDAHMKGKSQPNPEILAAFNKGGLPKVLRWQISDLEKTSKKQYVSLTFIAQLHAELGEREETIALLNQALSKHDPRLAFIQADPAFDFLHNDPRYISLVKKLGIRPTA